MTKQQNMLVCEAINIYEENGLNLSSIKNIQARLRGDYNLEIKDTRLSDILHKELNMRYKRIESISFKGNSV